MGKIYLTACVGLDHDIVLLDQFCTHYKALGIKPENFLLVLNTSEQNNISNNIKSGLQILDSHGIEPKDIWCTRYESEEKWSRVHTLLNKFVTPEDWVVHPDTDEFHEIPAPTYSDLLNEFDKKGTNALQGMLIDRLTADGSVPLNVMTKDVFKEFPVCADLNSLIKLAGVKLMAYRGFLRANNGSGQVHEQVKPATVYPHGKSISYHETPQFIKWVGDPDYANRDQEPEDWTLSMDELRNDIPYLVHHFKWHGRVVEKLEERVETYTRLKRAQVNQSIRALNHYREHGRFLLKERENK